MSYLSEMETGRKTINTRRIEALARALQTAPSQLFCDRDTVQHQRLLDLVQQMSSDQRDDVEQFARFVLERDRGNARGDA